MTDTVDPAKLARAIETELERTGSPERAAGDKRYLKSDMDFLGATLADIRRVARQAAKDPGLDRDGARPALLGRTPDDLGSEGGFARSIRRSDAATLEGGGDRVAGCGTAPSSNRSTTSACGLQTPLNRTLTPPFPVARAGR
jgi:hypothetical protein